MRCAGVACDDERGQGGLERHFFWSLLRFVVESKDLFGLSSKSLFEPEMISKDAGMTI